MLPTALQAYNTAYHRVVRDTPFFLLCLRYPVMPYGIWERESKDCYNVDDYKEEVSVFVNKVYDRCVLHMEESNEEMEKYHKRA